jgi:hypothetical protein
MILYIYIYINYKEMSDITNQDLYKNKYELSILEKNIMKLSGKTLLTTQHLTAEFCAKYILNDNYYEGVEEDYLYTCDYVLGKQKHISKEDLLYWIIQTPDAYY